MTDWSFILGNLAVDEPIGWDGANLKIIRDKVSHGISIAFSENDVTFEGKAATMLRQAYEADGLDAEIDLKVILMCDGAELFAQTFQLDFGTYDNLASDCRVKIGFEQITCFRKFKSNYDKKVDLDATLTFEGSAVKPLEFLKQKTVLPAKAYLKSSLGNVADEGESFPYTQSELVPTTVAFRPTLSNIKYESVSTSQLSNPSNTFTIATPDAGLDDLVSPILLYEEVEACASGKLTIDLRLKGNVHVVPTGLTIMFDLKAVILKSRENYHDAAEVLAVAQLTPLTGAPFYNPTTLPFDITFSEVDKPFVEGDTIFMMVGCKIDSQPADFTFNFDKETYVNISEKVLCKPTDANLFLPLETIERIADVTTNGCLGVKSDYYGRIARGYDEDGCGAGRSLTNGLFVRNAPEAKFFITAKEFLEGLKPIDAIGWALETEDTLRIEPIGYFYKDEEIAVLDNVPNVNIQTQPAEVAGTVKIGYDNWQVEKVNGLDEFNSTREFRSTIKNATGVYTLTTPIIASGYVIETVRDQNFAKTGAADTKYDNNIFTIQLDSNLRVEQGAEIATNVFDPPTILNFRIRPINMLMKWWSYLSGLTFRDTAAVNSKFVFTQGTGNYLASGIALGGNCSPERLEIAENSDVTKLSLKSTFNAQPILRPEVPTLEAELTMPGFMAIVANPYGYISYQSGVNEWRKGFINSITFKAKSSKANFELQNKYE